MELHYELDRALWNCDLKAFLSHATPDKSYVGVVADALGRQAVVYDAYSFDHGERFAAEILRGLEKSELFVLFLSRESMNRLWVDFELSEAETRVLAGRIRKGLCIIIDSSINHDAMPEWLKPINTPFVESPQVAARLIHEKLDNLRREALPALFMGRGADIEKVETLLSGGNDLRGPGILVLWGLVGIGRRTLAQRVAKDVLDFQRVVTLVIDVGDGLSDLRLKLATKYETLINKQDLIKLQHECDSSSEEENLGFIVGYCESMLHLREVPVFIDQGGLIDDEGNLTDAAKALAQKLHEKNLNAFLITRRKPADFEVSANLVLPQFRVNQLEDDATRRLLSQLFVRQNLQITRVEMEPLLQAVKGYPPAAYQAVSLIKEYGKELLLRNSNPIVRFREVAFLRLLEGNAKFEILEKSMLNILSTFGALPLPIIATALAADQDEVDSNASRLLNRALLNIDDDGYFSVSEPIREAVYKVFGTITVDFPVIDDALYDFIRRLEQSADGIAPLSLYRARFKAHVLAGRGRGDLFHMASDLIRLQQTLYHNQEYSKSIEFGEAARLARPRQPEISKYIVRAYIQLEDYAKSGDAIDELRSYGAPKEVKFLEGFSHRKRGNNAQAVVAYQSALAMGMGGVAIYRELGLCLFQENRLEEARNYLQRASEADPGNKFVLDAEVKIAILEDRIPDARRLLIQLDQVDTRARALHRRSTVEFASQNYALAYAASKESIDATDRPQFELLSQFINCAVITGHFEEAGEKLNQLSTRFRGLRMDIQSLLRGRYSLGLGNFDDALANCSRISDNSRKSRLRLHVDILSKQVSITPIAQRDAIAAELETLRRDVGPVKNVEMLEFDMD